MLQPKKLVGKLTIKPVMIGCVFSEPNLSVLPWTGLLFNKPKIELTEQDKARSAALILNLKNREYLEDQLNASGSDSPYWNLFSLGFLGGLIALLTPCVFP